MEDILNFWFDDYTYKTYWFDKSIDNYLVTNYETLLNEVKKEVEYYNKTKIKTGHILKYDNRLELIILCDQYSRNITRINNINYDILYKYSLDLATQWLQNHDENLLHIIFALMPFRHSNKPEYHRYVITYLNYYKKNYYKLSDEVIYNKFYKRSFDIKSYYELYYLILDDSIKVKIEQKQKLKSNNIYKILKKIKFNKSICVSLSGGVDSMVIADCLSKIYKNTDKKIICAHINYNNRKESKKEAEFLKLFCFDRNIYYEQLNIINYKRNDIKRENYEKTTTDIRYNFYKIIDKIYNISNIILGHHKGDIVENTLTNILKGRHILELDVIKEHCIKYDVQIFRPLISIYKDEIYNYAKYFDIPYFKDTTPSWSIRGKLRNKIIPVLNDTFGDINNRLINITNESYNLKTYFDKTNLDFKNVINNNCLFKYKLLIELKKHNKNMITNKSFNNLIKQLQKNNKETYIINISKDIQFKKDKTKIELLINQNN